MKVTTLALLLLNGLPGAAYSQALSVPTEVQLPGTQPLEVTNFVPPAQCDNCHGGYDLAVEPAHGWRGSMMSHAARDPIFWASVAVAEQDFDGGGDLCLRCHIARGWLDGRSTPTDGSAMLESDATGVSCDLCHSMVNPDGSEHAGIQNAPFLANDEQVPASGYYGNSSFVLSPTTDKLGPYADATSNNHGTIQSSFHRSEQMCATCHDVSNPVTGDLAHNNGAMLPLDASTFSGVPGAPVDGKAAFNNMPWAYGTIERTSSEHAIGTLSGLRISDYPSLPADLKAGSIKDAYDAALASTTSGDYADGTTRYFTCQTCHMKPATGKAAKQNFAPIRPDVALHDMTGGNYWMPQVIEYQDAQNNLRLGGNLSSDEVAGLQAGAARAAQNLGRAAALEINGDLLRVVNLTGHKLITGFPEGRRMWLHTTWRDAVGSVVREDGAYGPLDVQLQGTSLQVESLLDLDDPNARVYEVAYGLTQEWAAQLIALGKPAGLVLSYERLSGLPEHTLGELAAQPAGTAWHSMHFVLNNTTVSDSRIPPYGMGYDDALARGVLPVPSSQYGAPGPGADFEYWDEVQLAPPLGAATAEVELLYQPTSWEYVQFLVLANDHSVSSLANEGDKLLDAWLNTGMAAPVVMASASWQGGSSLLEYCFCEVGPCGNADASAGCANSSGAGAHLAPSGSTSVSSDDLSFVATNLLPGQPALLFVGVNGLSGLAFGDGLRCAGGNIRRLGVSIPAANGGAAWGPGLAAAGAWSSGETHYFQAWYRDPQSGPCSSGFNLSQGVAAYFNP